MPYYDEPPEGAFTLESDDLIMALVTDDDAPEAFDLMWHPQMTYLEQDHKPTSVIDLRTSFHEIRHRTNNNADFRRYQWTARLKDTGALVALVTADLDTQITLRTETGPAGAHTGDIVQEEVRVVERTVYVHPDYQGSGKYFGTNAVNLASKFARERFGCSIRRSKILLDNARSRRRAETNGMVLVRTGDPPGYGIWEAPND